MAIRNKRHSTSWSIAEAKSHLDDAIEEAEDAGPQTLVRNSDEQWVLVPAERWGSKPHCDPQRAGFSESGRTDHQSVDRGSGVMTSVEQILISTTVKLKTPGERPGNTVL
jgi:prevent-host-death family protein